MFEMEFKLEPIGKAIKNARKARHITQMELCKRSGVDYNTFKKVEEGTTRNPSAEFVAKVAYGLGICVSGLLRADLVNTHNSSTPE